MCRDCWAWLEKQSRHLIKREGADRLWYKNAGAAELQVPVAFLTVERPLWRSRCEHSLQAFKQPLKTTLECLIITDTLHIMAFLHLSYGHLAIWNSWVHTHELDGKLHFLIYFLFWGKKVHGNVLLMILLLIESIKKTLFEVTKIYKGKLHYYHRSPTSSSSCHCLIFLCQRALTGRTVTGRTVAELEVHTKKFYSSVEWKEISSTSLDLTKSPRNLAFSSVSSTSLTQESPYMDTYMKYSPSVCKHRNV